MSLSRQACWSSVQPEHTCASADRLMLTHVMQEWFAQVMSGPKNALSVVSKLTTALFSNSTAIPQHALHHLETGSHSKGCPRFPLRLQHPSGHPPLHHHCRQLSCPRQQHWPAWCPAHHLLDINMMAFALHQTVLVLTCPYSVARRDKQPKITNVSAFVSMGCVLKKHRVV